MNRSAFSFLLSLTAVSVASATILNVPHDYQTVTAAIDSAQAGDTVLVQPGTYHEALNFGGKAITVAGRFLLSHDPADIDSVILNANNLNTSVVRFDHGEDQNSRLIGFTLIGGAGSPDINHDLCGGGIHCQDSAPTLEHLKIHDCQAWVGGGIFIQRCSPTISDVEIYNNAVEWRCGGIYCSREGADPVITRALICGTTSVFGWSLTWGEDFGCYQGSRPTLINSTLIAKTVSAISQYQQTRLTLVNCLILAQIPAYIGWDPDMHDTLEVRYSDLKGGRDSCKVIQGSTLIWGDGNLAFDAPLADTAHRDFSPAWANYPAEDSTKSPVIDSGDPDSPLDPDSTRADMGAVYFQQGGIVRGVIQRALDQSPISGARVVSNFGPCGLTNDQGHFMLGHQPVGEFSLTASCPGYTDTTLTGLVEGFHDTLEVTIPMRGPLALVRPDSMSINLDSGDSTQTEFTLENRGNEQLDYTAEVRPSGEFGKPFGALRDTVSLDSAGLRVYGPALVNNFYYIPARTANLTKMVYMADRNGRIVDSFMQINQESSNGYHQLVWDGEKFWATVEENNMLYAFTLQGDSITSAQLHRAYQYVTWDSRRKLLWQCLPTTNIFGFDVDSNEIVSTLSRRSLFIYGLGYQFEDPDGYFLYALTSDAHLSKYSIYKFNTDNGDTLHVADLDTALSNAGYQFYGASTTSDNDRYHNTIMLCGTGRKAKIATFQIGYNRHWALIDPPVGQIAAGDHRALSLTINASDLIPELYPGEIRIQHNAPGLLTVLPFTVQIRANSVSDSPLTPYTLHLSPCFPNPFNASTTISFALPKAGWTKMDVVDIGGRSVERITNCRLEAGEHKIVWNATGLPNGLYLVKLQQDKLSSTQKLVLLK